MVDYRCPSCKKSLTERAEHFPFCSERCKLKDLGAWATGAYAVPGEEASPEEISKALQENTSSSKKRRDAH
jgi:endogenous inhibitor of DNA gyrase (YacG/DUF329 family)